MPVERSPSKDTNHQRNRIHTTDGALQINAGKVSPLAIASKTSTMISNSESPNPFSSSNKLIMNQLAELTKKVNYLEAQCNELKCENKSLKDENRKLKQNDSLIKNLNTDDEKSVSEFYTDEEELSKETDWILKKRPSKKRKAESSPVLHQNATTQKSMPMGKISSNHPTSNAIPKTSAPPPIMVSGITDYYKFVTQIKECAKDDFSIKLINNGIHKLNTKNSNDYRIITEKLNKLNISWYSYENKQSRPIRVMVKNLHRSCDPELIVSDLKAQGFKATEAVRKLKWKTKEPLDMFLLTFDSSEDVSKIHNIKYILASVVKIESVKRPNIIPQCKKCQAFGHTKNYCSRAPRCVKCAGKHSTESCTKHDKQQPKCCNCGENHPANYRGCVVAKELQTIRNKTIQQTTKPKNTRTAFHTEQRPANVTNIVHQPPSQVAPLSKKDSNQISYAQAAKNAEINVHYKSNTDLLTQILQKLNNQEQFNLKMQHRLDLLEQSTSKSSKYAC